MNSQRSPLNQDPLKQGHLDIQRTAAAGPSSKFVHGMLWNGPKGVQIKGSTVAEESVLACVFYSTQTRKTGLTGKA